MILVRKGIFRYFLVAPLGIGVSNSNGGKNEADTLDQNLCVLTFEKDSDKEEMFRIEFRLFTIENHLQRKYKGAF